MAEAVGEEDCLENAQSLTCSQGGPRRRTGPVEAAGLSSAKAVSSAKAAVQEDGEQEVKREE